MIDHLKWNSPRDKLEWIPSSYTDFYDTVETKKVEAPKIWEIPLKTADQLTNCINNNKHEQPHAVLALSNDAIDTYSNSVRVYIDESKTSDGKVGVGCYFEPTRGSAEMRLAHTVTDHVSIYSYVGEMAAIWLATQTAGQLQKQAQSAAWPNGEQACSRQREVTVVWVSDHIGIHGNEIADQLAAEGMRQESP